MDSFKCAHSDSKTELQLFNLQLKLNLYLKGNQQKWNIYFCIIKRLNVVVGVDQIDWNTEELII